MSSPLDSNIQAKHYAHQSTYTERGMEKLPWEDKIMDLPSVACMS